MKKSISLFVLILVIACTFTKDNKKDNKEKSKTNLKRTGNKQEIAEVETKNSVPIGNDLNNHYGLDTLNSPYGVGSNFDVAHFVKENAIEFDKRNEVTDFHKQIEEITNENSLNPFNIKSGNLKNTARGAKELIDPSKANPKLGIKTTIEYPKVIEYADFKGYSNKIKNVTVLDKKSNRITKENVLVSEPVYERKRQVAYMPTTLEAQIDLKEKTIIEPSEASTEKVLHGIDRAD